LGKCGAERAQQWDRSLVRLRTLGILERVDRVSECLGTEASRGTGHSQGRRQPAPSANP
jgi:hypothetical protein